MILKKILIIGLDESKLEGSYWDRIKSLSEQTVFMAKDSSNLAQELSDTDCLLVNFGVTIDKDQINSAPNLKYIGIMATAFGKVDVAHAKEKGIIVTHLPGYSTEAVAEFTIAAILEQIRCLSEGRSRAKSGNYSEDGIKATEIRGKKFGIIGLGSIGTRVAELAQGFGAEIQYWSRNRKPQQEAKGMTYKELAEVLGTSDFLSINLAQTPETEKILGSEQFSKLKKDAVVVNTAPMELIDLEALGVALVKGGITFILDHSDEMEADDLKFLGQYDDCVIYPPIAYITEEARVAKQEMFTGNVENFAAGSPTNEVK